MNQKITHFADYITLCKKHIAKHRTDLKNPNDPIITDNAPFEFESTQTNLGILLIHGLLDSPFATHDIAKSLSTLDLPIQSILLPGHATHPNDLLNVSYKDWLTATRLGIDRLAKKVEKIILIGISTGAMTALHETLKKEDPIVGLILIAPAFKIKTPLDFLIGWLRNLGKIWPRAAWAFKTKEIDYAKYSSIPFNAAYQVYRLAKATRKLLKKKNTDCPQLYIVSNEDAIVDNKKTLKYFVGTKNPDNEMLYYSAKPYFFPDRRIIVRNAYYPEKNILNLSHIAIPISPDNKHYGEKGDFIHASHSSANKNLFYCELNKPKKLYYKTLKKLNWTPYEYQRLTFNPDFDFMLKTMRDFISSIETQHPRAT